jgi:hypothetical protein
VTRNTTRLRRSSVHWIRHSERLVGLHKWLYWYESHESGEKGESNPKGSVAVFWLLLACVAVKHPSTTLDRSSHHPAGFTTQSAQSKALPIRIRAWEAGGEPRDTTHLSLIGAESGVAATLQNCGESRTISPMHCNIPTSRSFSAPRIPFLIFYPQVELIVVPSFGRAYISSDVAEVLIPSHGCRPWCFGYVRLCPHTQGPHSCCVAQDMFPARSRCSD